MMSACATEPPLTEPVAAPAHSEALAGIAAALVVSVFAGAISLLCARRYDAKVFTAALIAGWCALCVTLVGTGQARANELLERYKDGEDLPVQVGQLEANCGSVSYEELEDRVDRAHCSVANHTDEGRISAALGSAYLIIAAGVARRRVPGWLATLCVCAGFLPVGWAMVNIPYTNLVGWLWLVPALALVIPILLLKEWLAHRNISSMSIDSMTTEVIGGSR